MRFKKVNGTTRMARIFAIYAARKGKPQGALRFLVEGELVSGNRTVASLELEDYDVLNRIREHHGAKPVILLYPETAMDVTVRVQLSSPWQFSALYPTPAMVATNDNCFPASQSEQMVSMHMR